MWRTSLVVLSLTIALSSVGGCDFLSGDDSHSDQATGVCEPGDMLCIGDELNRCNVAGSSYVPLAECEYGCEAGDCQPKPNCQPSCDGQACGDDGCGSQCGYCAEGKSCSLGKCVATGDACEPGHEQCSGNDLVVCVSNGSMYTLLSSCQFGCEDAACKSKPGCTPSCSGKECGDDGCSGNCGSCSSGYVCMGWQCLEERTECHPDCSGKKCGPDGCGGDCGLCPSGTLCEMSSGSCVSQGNGVISGKIMFEYRTVAADDYGQLFLQEAGTTGAFGLVAAVWDSGGNFLGATEVAEDGSYAIPVSKSVDGTEQFAFLAMWIADWEDDIPNPLVILDAKQGGQADSGTRTIWGWGAEVQPGGKMGSLTITEESGSGAIFLLMFAREAMEIALFDFLQGDLAKIKPLGLLWAPNAPWDCGACYWPGPQYDENGGQSCEQSIFIGGLAGGSSAWGYPVILHEMGHYVAGNYSRDDSPGGDHGYGQPVIPPFAWSEGWASFFAVASFSRAMGEPSALFWDIQQGEGFWLDYEAAETSLGPAGLVGPSPDGSMAQLMDESYIAAMLWHLWDGADFADPEPDGTALGMEGVVEAMTSARFLNEDRGAQGADMVDFLDAAMCNAPGLAQSIYDTTVSYLGFPHDGEPLCYNRTRRPMSLALKVDKGASGTRATVRVTAHGALPPNMVLWTEVKNTASEQSTVARRDLLSPLRGDTAEVVLSLPDDVAQVAVRAVAQGSANAAFAKATWPSTQPKLLALKEAISVPERKFRGFTVNRLIPLTK